MKLAGPLVQGGALDLGFSPEDLGRCWAAAWRAGGAVNASEAGSRRSCGTSEAPLLEAERPEASDGGLGEGRRAGVG